MPTLLTIQKEDNRGIRFESGWDNSVRWDDSVDLWTADLNGYNGAALSGVGAYGAAALAARGRTAMARPKREGARGAKSTSACSTSRPGAYLTADATQASSRGPDTGLFPAALCGHCGAFQSSRDGETG